jgi:hypothetical protein
MEEKARRLAVSIYHALLIVSGRKAAQDFQAEVEQSTGEYDTIVLIARHHLGITVLVDEFKIEQAEKAAVEEE